LSFSSSLGSSFGSQDSIDGGGQAFDLGSRSFGIYQTLGVHGLLLVDDGLVVGIRTCLADITNSGQVVDSGDSIIKHSTNSGFDLLRCRIVAQLVCYGFDFSGFVFQEGDLVSLGGQQAFQCFSEL